MKWGLGGSYDDVQFLSKKTRAYLDLCQPASSIGVTVAFALASVFYFYYNGNGAGVQNNILTIVYSSATVMFAHAASQSLNMAEDAEMDKQTEHKQNRPIPSGVVTEEEARSIAWIMAGFALVRGYLVRPIFGVFVTLLVFLGVFYNLSPIRAKSRSISIPWQAVSRGLLSFPLVWAAYGNPFNPTPWVLGVFMFFYVMSYQNTADIADRHADEKYGVDTFVVMFGVRRTGYIAVVGTLMMSITIVTSIYTGLLAARFIWMLAVVPLCVLMLYYMIVKPEYTSDSTGNSPAYLYYYLGMVVCIAIPTVVEVLH